MPAKGRREEQVHVAWMTSVLQRPKAAFCDHTSFLFVSCVSHPVATSCHFSEFGLSDYALKIKKMLPLQQNGFHFTSKASHSLCFEEKKKREWESVRAVPFIWTFILTWEYLVFCVFPSHVTLHWFSLNQTSHHHRLLQKKVSHEGALGLE